MESLRVSVASRWLCALVCVCTFTTVAGAQDAPPTLEAGRFPDGAAAPTIDGRVDEDAWQRATPYSTFTQQDPFEGQPATERTEVRLLIGRGNLYIGIIAFDSNPSRIIAAQARRDAALGNVDSVIVALDTFNDNQNAFVFGTNPLGIEYDGQVASEGQSGGGQVTSGTGGSQRGSIGAFNANWDGDWTVRAQVTARGWETEMVIPLKTLRYPTGNDRTWGFNVMRNIRHKNEQVYLAPIPRGFDIYRVSLAAKLQHLDLPPRRDLKLTPYTLGSVNKDYTRTTDQLDRRGDLGVDLKWGVRPNLTLDLTVNTDFAQVEADEEQVNLTRFDVFFPEKRAFFLENASTFQFGQAQAIDVFFTRRIGLSATGSPIDILGGARLSGKVGQWNTGLLNIQTADAEDASGARVAPANNFTVLRAQREVGRSNWGAIVVNRQGVGDGAGSNNWNRAYGLDGNWQASANQRFAAFVARTDTPGTVGSDYAARGAYNFTNNLWQVTSGFSRVGNDFNPEVGFLPRRGYQRPEWRVFFQPQPKNIPWIRRIAPHTNGNVYYGLDGVMQSANVHLHPFEIQPRQGGRFGWYMDYAADNPTRPFTVYNRDGRQVRILPGNYDWWQQVYEYLHNPSAVVTGTVRYRRGHYYNGDFQGFEIQGETRIGSRFTASAGWTRQDIDLPTGAFVTDLIPMKASWAFTPLANVQALVQYNGQTAQFSSNIRLALLTRGSTGFFIVYNDRRDTTATTPYETIGRSFIVKFTRLFDF
jgi:Domain of unknown function (DUF5916)/Carbohydrate family 9 binding domain-like